MENERPIEKLLHRFAKKRRDEAGTPLDLHPATRRMLQGEVSRHFKQRPAGTPGQRSGNWLTMFWPKLVWAVPVVVIVGLGVWSVVRDDRQHGANFELAQAKPSDKVEVETVPAAPPAVSIPVNAPMPLSKTKDYQTRDPADAESLGKSRAVAPPQRRPDDADGFRVAEADRLESDESKKQAISFADRSRQQIPAVNPTPTSIRPIETSSGTPVQLDSMAFKTATPAAETIRAREEVALAPAPTVQSRALGVTTSSVALTNQMNRTVTTPVLANFRVEQTGAELRVIDADGSTYLGRISQAQTPQQFGAGPAATSDSTVSRGGTAQPAQRYFDAATQLNWNFRVSGTNRTRDELVIFSGNYAGPSNAIQDSRFQNVAQPLQTQPGTTTATGERLAPAQAILINGEAQIGDRAFEIRASRVGQ